MDHWHKMWPILIKLKCLQYRNLAIKLNEWVKFSVKHSVMIINYFKDSIFRNLPDIIYCIWLHLNHTSYAIHISYC